MTEGRPDQAGPRPLDRLDRIQTIEDRAAAAIEALDKAITPRTTPEQSPSTPTRRRRPDPLEGLPLFLAEVNPRPPTTPAKQRRPDPMSYQLGDDSRALLDRHLERRKQIFGPTVEVTPPTDQEQSPEEFWPTMPETTED